MDIKNIKLFNLMQSNINYLTTRQDVLSQNVANSSTPGYETVDIKKPDFSSYLSKSSGAGLVTTNSNHISGTKNASGGNIIESKSFETKPTGNRVVLEEEMLKITKNSMEYQQTTNIYRKMIEMFKTAIGNV
jgi:flagellar basal-body rod protein FlgB